MNQTTQERLRAVLREYRQVCFRVRDNKPSIDGLQEGIDQAEQAILALIETEIIGENEEVPEDIWADPRPEKVRAQNELRQQQRTTLRGEK